MNLLVNSPKIWQRRGWAYRLSFGIVRVMSLLVFSLSGCDSTVSGPEGSTEVVSSLAQNSQAPPVNYGHLQQDWPCWRGPLRNGHAPDQPLLTHWSETENIHWRVDVPGRGHSSPIVVNDLVLLTTALEQTEQQWVLAFDRLSGEKCWSTLVNEGSFPAPGKLHHKSTQANGSVATDGVSVWATFMSSETVFLYALELETGKQLWKQAVCSFAPEFGYAPSPVMHETLILINGDNNNGGDLAAYDKSSGKLVWRTTRPKVHSFSTPVVLPIQGQSQILLSGANQIISYDPATGKELWDTSGPSKATCGSLVGSENFIYASGGFPERQTQCVDHTGQLVWSQRVKLYEPSLLLAGDALYGITDEGIAYCWNARTGEEHWKQRLQGSFSASPVLCNGLIYVSNLSGQTFVFRASADSYQEVAVNKLGDDCYTSAAVVQSQLFLRIGIGTSAQRQEQLVCLTQTP